MSPVVINPPSAIPEMRTDTKQLQNLMTRQQIQMADQRYQAKIKQRTGAMLSAAKESLQRWKKVPDQVLVAGSKKDNSDSDNQDMDHVSASRNYQKTGPSPSTANGAGGENIIKTGDILFAVMDTSVNTDEPGPILATIDNDICQRNLLSNINSPQVVKSSWPCHRFPVCKLFTHHKQLLNERKTQTRVGLLNPVGNLVFVMISLL